MGDFAVSVIIPAYNAAGRIHSPLEGLALQVDEVDRFEVIIVDNASTDDLERVVEASPATALLRRKGHSVRVVREPRPGSTYARLRGLLESNSDVVACLDDDNEPTPGYLAAGIAAMADPGVGMLISRVVPVHEVPPPPSVRKREHLLGTNGYLGDKRIVWGPETILAPTIGAGMWVRRALFLELVPWQDPDALLAGRLGTSLACGEDIEIGVLFGLAGYQRIYVPEMLLKHILAGRRQESRYFCRLIIGITRSDLDVRARYCGYSHKPIAGIARMAVAAAAAPILIFRRDGRREVLFILAARWAEFLGPFRAHLRPSNSPAPQADKVAL